MCLIFVDEPIIDLDTDDQEPATVEESPTDNVDKEKEKTPTNRKTSIVWDHFPKVEGAKKTKCKYCGTLMSSNTRNGTSALLSHLTNVCKNSPLYKKLDLKRWSTLSFKPTNKWANGSGSLTTHSFSQEKCRLALAKICIKDNWPFSVVDDEVFREFVWELNPKFKICFYVRSSSVRYKTFKDFVARATIECKQNPCLDVDTRWNSTYLMLETTVKYEQAFDRLYMIDSNCGAHFRSEVTDDCEWNTRKRKKKR
uniref:BED-type domain-containing protein n=1 Tax=Lactuca sativa TaxID=4236 RepID=A0A9R1UY93_LACSA|nr:hypothetical protein LSAT_V11C700370030 [Lactuca sativa]